MNRRQFVRATSLATAGAIVGLRSTANAAPGIELLDTRVISHEPGNYSGWPTLKGVAH